MNKRHMIRCCLPNGHKHPKIIEALEFDLATDYKGFTRYPMLGCWVDDNGALEREAGCVYEVSFGQSWRREDAAALFRAAARTMGETWVHIEYHTFDEMHTKVN